MVGWMYMDAIFKRVKVSLVRKVNEKRRTNCAFQNFIKDFKLFIMQSRKRGFSIIFRDFSSPYS